MAEPGGEPEPPITRAFREGRFLMAEVQDLDPIPEHVATAAEYRQALPAIHSHLTDNMLAMLRFQARVPGRTATELAQSIGYTTYHPANRQYGELGKLVASARMAAFHIDHVVSRTAGGPTTAENLALACVSCSLRKWARQTAPDPESGSDVPLFNPRTQVWREHFCWDGEEIVPLSPTGRATVAALAMNRTLIVAIRREETAWGRHPPE